MCQIIHSLEDIDQSQDRVLVMGFFDGVHLGHQSLLAKMRQIAKDRSLRGSVYTFTDPPRKLFQPDLFQGLLQTREDRYESLSKLGAEEIFAMPLIKDILGLDPNYFMEEILLKRLRAKAVVVGSDFTFGYKAMGNVSRLLDFAKNHDIDVEVVGDYIWEGKVLSSSLIREKIQANKIKLANSLMAKPFNHKSTVVPGQKLGRRLGFPTLNIVPAPELIELPYGVYLSNIEFEKEGKVFELPAITSIGVRPTVDGSGEVKSETYILSDSYPDYGDYIQVSYLDFMRPEIKFSTVEELRLQVLSDIEDARSIHKMLK